MKKSNSFKILFKDFFSEINTRRKFQLFLLVLLMCIASFAEMLSIGAVIPFVAVITNPLEVINSPVARDVLQFFNIYPDIDLVWFITLFFIIALTISGFIRVLLMWAQISLSTAIGTDFSVKVYEKTLYRKYSFHLKKSSSEILAGSQKAKEIADLFVYPLLTICSSVLIFITILCSLLIINTAIAISALLSFCLIYFIIILITKNTVKKNSQILAIKKIEVTRLIQEGLGGIKDVIINGYQGFYLKRYQQAFTSLQMANASNTVISQSPRFIVETLGMILIVILASILSKGKDSSMVLPTLSALALGAQRLLPLLQQIYSSYVVIKGAQNGTEDAIALLKKDDFELEPNTSIKPITFEHSITLENVKFSYFSNQKMILNEINLKIPYGSRLGVVGESGSGKSTLIDIIMGLLSPTSGKLLVDNLEVNQKNLANWRVHISHVPQSIYLVDASIAENIAFGVIGSEIDMNRVMWAADQANISKIIDSWPDGYKTTIGERGVRLSGGQRQRIGIARALYKHAKILILDESTSALDVHTESNVMKCIESIKKDITIIIISHRLSTLKKCDKIVEISAGKIIDRGTKLNTL